jgi:glucose/arabinose dehydrogenase/cytochrome c553
MKKTLPLLIALGATTAAGGLLAVRQGGSAPARAATAPQCSNDSGLSLPPGFCATIFADNLGHARQMAMGADGTLYVNTWSSNYFQEKPDPTLGYVVALRDTNGDGKADKTDRFGPTPNDKSTGGTGIALYKGGLFVETDDTILRYPLKPGQVTPSGAATTVLTGLPMSGDHMMHPIAIDAAGNLFVNSGSPSNVCEKANRQPGSLGKDPCDELPTRAGIWKYSAAKTGQAFSLAERYATGIRNTGGMAFDAAGNLFAVQHGRDQLSQSWPAFFTIEQGAERPAEELMLVKKGDDFGWPYCYYDGFQKKRVLAPEYGGDGGKIVGKCARMATPVSAFPAHYAPTGVTYYAGTKYPAAYKGGLFISFHGSWNRAPRPQDGFKVYFQPMKNGKASGEAILFADGFAGPDRGTARAPHRPTGILAGTDGALYVSDDVKGRIWKISYQGPAGAALVAAKPAPVNAVASDAGEKAALPVGFTAEQVALGDKIYHGLERSGTCAGCHGADGKGSTIGPALTGPTWLWGDGSIAAIRKTVAEGVTEPKKYPSGMPAKGGSPLSDADVAAVSAYVWTLGEKK